MTMPIFSHVYDLCPRPPHESLLILLQLVQHWSVLQTMHCPTQPSTAIDRYIIIADYAESSSVRKYPQWTDIVPAPTLPGRSDSSGSGNCGKEREVCLLAWSPWQRLCIAPWRLLRPPQRAAQWMLGTCYPAWGCIWPCSTHWLLSAPFAKIIYVIYCHARRIWTLV